MAVDELEARRAAEAYAQELAGALAVQGMRAAGAIRVAAIEGVAATMSRETFIEASARAFDQETENRRSSTAELMQVVKARLQAVDGAEG